MDSCRLIGSWCKDVSALERDVASSLGKKLGMHMSLRYRSVAGGFL